MHRAGVGASKLSPAPKHSRVSFLGVVFWGQRKDILHPLDQLLAPLPPLPQQNKQKQKTHTEIPNFVSVENNILAKH